MSIIAAGTTTTTALSSTGNTDGTLQFQVNGTTPSVTLNTLGAIGVGSTPGYGTSGQVLTSAGSTAAPSWSTNVSSQWTTTGSDIYYNTGNVGLGVTPSAWASGWSAMQFGARGSVGYVSGAFDVAINVVSTSTTENYLANSYAARYRQQSGQHIWFNAPIGTAGNAISFTQAMTLDANGLLQVGATSPINSGAVTFASTGGTYNQLELCDTRAYSSTPNSSLGFAVKYNSAGSYTNMAAIVGTKENATDGNYSGALLFYTSLNGSGSAERARINSSGDLLLGISSANAVNGITFASLGASTPYGLINQSASGTLMFFRYNSTTVGSITQNTTSTTYATSSDYRLKNTIAPMTGALAKVAQLKPCTYKWNADGSDGEGFIAHELAEVVPQCVTGEKDAVETYVDEDGNEQTRPVYQGIDTSFLVATLTAAIQELKAEFDAYKASHP